MRLLMVKDFSDGSRWSNSKSSVEPQSTHFPPKYLIAQARRASYRRIQYALLVMPYRLAIPALVRLEGVEPSSVHYELSA